MGYTSFGEFVRTLRIRRNEVLGDMAKNLDTSLAFLSAVENGRKNVPSAWYELLVEKYQLNEEEGLQLKDAIDESRLQFKIVPGKSGKYQRRAAMAFTRSFEDMDDETAMKIIEILEKRGKD